MAFFSDLKKITSSAMSVASDGMKLLNEAAEALERGTHIFSLQTSAKYLELDISPEKRIKLSPQELQDKEEELRSIYDDLISCVDLAEKEHWVSKRQALFSEQKKRGIEQRVDHISILQKRISQSTKSLPCEIILKIKRLISKIDDLIRFIGADTKSPLVKELISIKNESLFDIKALEAKRNTIELEYFPSGALKSRIHKRDNKKNGRSEFWYENGVKRLELNYISDQLTAEAWKWTEDGCLILEANYGHSSDKFDLELFSKSGVRIFSTHLNKYKYGWAQIWLSNQLYVGQLYISAGKVSAIQKIMLVVKLILNLSFWVKLLGLKFKHNTDDHSPTLLFEELNDRFMELNKFSREINEFKEE